MEGVTGPIQIHLFLFLSMLLCPVIPHIPMRALRGLFHLPAGVLVSSFVYPPYFPLTKVSS
jgi:hypothetical protein